jgi:transposase
MSMHPQPIPTIPEETVRVARAVLPKGNVFLRMRDELGTLYTDEDFRDLFPLRGQPAEVPWRLALVTIMQYGEGLTDRQAADAVRTRIDWKYVLSLELTDSGFDFSVLSEFRSRLLDQGAERRLFDRLIEQCARTRLDQSTWQTANRFDPCIGSRPHTASARMRWRDQASRAQCAVRGCA